MIRVALAALLTLAALPAHAKTIVIAEPAWPTAKVAANILEHVLKGKFGAAVELRPGATRDLQVALETGAVDVHPELWMSSETDADVRAAVTDGTVRLASHFTLAGQHMCTTAGTAAATGLRALTDLAKPEMAKRFDTDGDGLGEVWIGEDAWRSPTIERIRAKTLGYDKTMTLLTMPEELAMASVDAAVATDAPIVFYCYTPHYVFRLHDVVMLDEPPYDAANWVLTGDTPVAKSGWEPARVQAAFRADLAAEHPDIARFVDRYALTEDEAEAVTYAIDVEHRDPAEFATEWIEKNPGRIEEWTK